MNFDYGKVAEKIESTVSLCAKNGAAVMPKNGPLVSPKDWVESVLHELCDGIMGQAYQLCGVIALNKDLPESDITAALDYLANNEYDPDWQFPSMRGDVK